MSTTPDEVGDPFTAAEIADALEARHASSVAYWSTFDTAAFHRPFGTAWSPADNVRHLTTTMRAVTRGLLLPRIVLFLKFRRPDRPSRRYAEVRDAYRARLAQGGTAGRFGPRPRPEPADPEAERATVMQYHALAVQGIRDATSRWSEQALDRRQLPHPLMGPLSVREMLLFTLYHNQHHVDNVRRYAAT
jgi:hypothetical protein